jgi:hypothetical protein
MVRRGAFAGRVVVEICQDLAPSLTPPHGAAPAGQFAISACGRPAEATVQLVYGTRTHTLTTTSGEVPDFDELRQVTFDLPTIAAHDLKIWAHRATPDGLSESLHATAEVRSGASRRAADLGANDGQAVLPLDGPAGGVTLRFDALDSANTLD